MQELNREAEEHGEEIPAWFVTAVNVRRTNGGLCFCFVHVHVTLKKHVMALEGWTQIKSLNVNHSMNI